MRVSKTLLPGSSPGRPAYYILNLKKLMKLLKNIKIKKFPFTKLPIISSYNAYTIYPNIYISKNTYDNLQTKSPNPKNVAVLIHEQTHIKRQKETGWFLWGLKYCFLKKFRFNEELVAIKESMKYLKIKNIKWDTEKSAKYLSSYLYLWCTDYKNAKEKLDKIYKEA
jgi:hypothetical protein